MDNPYLELTEEFNRGRLRVLLSSGQAVVVHRLAVMSKDGDWIVREDAEAVSHVLEVLSLHGARYRFGAPLDLRWLAGGWSAHLELRREALRIRTDFVTRPPRIAPEQLTRMWNEAEATGNEALAEAIRQRPLLARIAEGREPLEEALDRERRVLMRINEERLARYQAAAEPWAKLWPDVQRQMEGLLLLDAHCVLTSRAEGVLPFEPSKGGDS